MRARAESLESNVWAWRQRCAGTPGDWRAGGLAKSSLGAIGWGRPEEATGGCHTSPRHHWEWALAAGVFALQGASTETMHSHSKPFQLLHISSFGKHVESSIRLVSSGPNWQGKLTLQRWQAQWHHI